MSNESIKRLLLVEDELGFARFLREMFKEQGSAETELTHVDCMADAEAELVGHAFDIILLDPGLPDSQGIESVQRAHAAGPRTPLVVLTGRDDESLALQALQEGAQDYLIKGQIDTRGLLRFLRYAIERNTMEEALFVAEERAQVTLNSIGDAVACTDAEGRITFLNIPAEGLTGWSLQEANGRPLAEVIRILDATSRAAIPDPMTMAVERDRVVHLPSNSILVRRDGFETPIEESVAPIHDRDENTAGAVIVFRDVSAARSSQQLLRAVSEELERSNRELQDFATIASHDLQEPLRKIQAFGDRLAERSADALDEEASDYLLRMTNAAGRMQTLINDLLEYSQVTIRPEPPRPVDLGLVVSEVLSDLDERIRVTNGQVTVGPLPTILASPLQMRQLFQNLIANALKFHPEGVAPQVHIEAVARGDGRGPKARRDRPAVWEIRVRDNGIGFEEKHVERIFAPFQRLHGRHDYEGTGMGLAICRRIVGVLGGTLTATSQPGAGATFVIILPQSAVVVDALAPVA
ncbi:MAG: ATP-binding protein [Chloroflexota bacterium]